MRVSLVLAAVVAVVLSSTARPATAAISGLQRVASGLSNPMFVTHAPGDTSRLFIAQRGGAIRILDLNTGVLQATPFLSTTVDTAGEGGLLGLAFHPDYFNRGHARLRQVLCRCHDRLAVYDSRPRVHGFADEPQSGERGLVARNHQRSAYAATNHNGGWIGFSPNDNYLYIATGDGGGGNDDGTGHTPGTGNAQDTTNNCWARCCASMSTAMTSRPIPPAITPSRPPIRSKRASASRATTSATMRSGRTACATRSATASIG